MGRSEPTEGFKVADWDHVPRLLYGRVSSRTFNLIAFVFNCNYPTTAALLFQNNCFTAVGGGGGGPRG